MSEGNNLPDNIDIASAESKDVDVSQIKSSSKYLGNVTASSTGDINYSGATSAVNNGAVVKASASDIIATENFTRNCQNNKDASLGNANAKNGGKEYTIKSSEDKEHGEVNSDKLKNSTDVFEFSGQEENTGKPVSAPVNLGAVLVKPVSIPAATFYNTRIFGKASVCSISKDDDIQRPKVSLFDNNNAAGEISGQSIISREPRIESGPDQNVLEKSVSEIQDIGEGTDTHSGQIIPCKSSVRVIINDTSTAKIVDVTGGSSTKSVNIPIDTSHKSADISGGTPTTNSDVTGKRDVTTDTSAKITVVPNDTSAKSDNAPSVITNKDLDTSAAVQRATVNDTSTKSVNVPRAITDKNVDTSARRTDVTNSTSNSEGTKEDDLSTSSQQVRPLKKRKTEDSIMQQMESIHGNKDSESTISTNNGQNADKDSQILERAEDTNTSFNSNIIHHTLRDEAERTPSNKPEANNLPPISKSYSTQNVEDLSSTARQLFGINTRSMAAPTPPVLMSYKMKKAKISKSKRSGITFPVTRTLHKLQRGRYARHVGVGAGVYMAAVLEYLVAEVLELSGAFTKDDARVRITPRHIMLTLRMDRELDELTKDTTIPQSGVTPCIHPALLPSSSTHQPMDLSKLKYPNDPYRGHKSTPKP